MEDGDTHSLSSAGRDDGHVSQRLDSRWAEQRPAGRHGEPPSCELAESIRSFGFEMGRLKTGTPPRLDRRSIDFERRSRSACSRRKSGDAVPVPFSFTTTQPLQNQVQLLAAAHERPRARSRSREHRIEPAVQRTDSGHRPALLPVARRQDHAVSRPGAASDLSRAGRRRTSTRSTSTASRCRCRARSRRSSFTRLPGLEDAVDAAARLRRGVRFRATDRTEVDARNASSRAGCFSPGRSTGHLDTRRRQRRG